MTAECEEIVAASPTEIALDQLKPNSTSSPGDILRPTTNNKENTETNQKTTFWLKEAIYILIEQWFLVSLGLLIAIASQVQVPADQQKLKRTVTSYLCISIIFFA
jgi:sodium/bile acid cotransporter 7